MCQGAKSPLAPTDPCSGINGWTPLLTISDNRRSTTGRTPEYPLAITFARRTMIARIVGSSKEGPTPTEWLRMRLRCTSRFATG